MSTTLRGGCHCGNVQLRLSMPRACQDYEPRRCDCSFCRQHGAAYVSDALAQLSIHINDAGLASRYRQGSEQAELLLCARCGVLIGALYQEADRWFGTVNVRALEDTEWGPERMVSPKTLSPAQKTARWRTLWCADVRLTSG